jgi:D-amino peptidase
VRRMIRGWLLTLVTLWGLSTSGAVGATQGRLRVLISVDMEGVAGTVTGDQLGPTGFEYGRFRDFMTREALAAVTAARAAGATDVIVADAHGNGENLLIEQFPPEVRVIRSWPRRLGMVAGVDQQIDAVIFIGYHASTNNPSGVRAHTFSSATLTRVTLNGVNVSEGSWAAAIAGQFNVPVIMISGDDAAIAEVRSAVGNIEAAETKRTLGFHSAITLTPQASCDLISARVKSAIARRAEFKPYKVATPVTVEMGFKNYLPAEVLAYLPMFERADSHSVRFRARDMAEAEAIRTFIGTFRADLTP